MTDTDTDFREGVKRAVRRNDPDPDTLTAAPEHLASLANGETDFGAERVVLKTAAGDVAIVARDGALAVEQA